VACRRLHLVDERAQACLRVAEGADGGLCLVEHAIERLGELPELVFGVEVEGVGAGDDLCSQVALLQCGDGAAEVGEADGVQRLHVGGDLPQCRGHVAGDENARCRAEQYRQREEADDQCPCRRISVLRLPGVRLAVRLVPEHHCVQDVHHTIELIFHRPSQKGGTGFGVVFVAGDEEGLLHGSVFLPFHLQIIVIGSIGGV